MAKKIMQDMVVRKKRRPIPIERKREPEVVPETKPQEPFYIDKDKVKDKVFAKEREKSIVSSKFKLAYKLAIVLFAIFAFIFVLKSFSWVSLLVTPKQEFINLDIKLESFIATTQDTSKSNGSQNIYFELMEVSEEREKTVKSTGVKELERKASGQIIIYNAYSSASQALSRRTRFSTPDGKIYRIDDQIVVPGAKIVDGSIVPSAIEVTVYADSPGEEYNIGLTDFSIPGFKGDVKYEKFYARSKTEMSDGFVGELSVVTSDDILFARESLREEIKDSLIKKAITSIPNGFLYYQDLTMLDFVSDSKNPKEGDETENFTIKEKGVVKVFLMREVDLSDALVSRYMEIGAPVRISNLKDATMTLLERTKDNDKIIFNVNGNGHFVWNIDEDNLKKDFLEKGGDKTESFLKNYPMDNIKITFHPSWWRLIPKDITKVKYEEILKTGF